MKLLPSKITAAWVLLVLSSAFYARDLLAFLDRYLAPNDYLIWGSLLLFALILLTITRRVWPGGTLLIGEILLLGLLAASLFEVSVERMHLVKYGVMGFFYSLDILKNNRSVPGKTALFLSTSFCALVAATDESCQHFIPDRVGDLRDVGFGAVGGLWGALIGVCLKRKGKL
ncbi:MAG: VanZ family protein [Deltaproteobacteria bacterium]|nr:VanZ family protein [Deltaproteobacteria bacterium]